MYIYNLISSYVYERLSTCLDSLDGPKNDYYIFHLTLNIVT